MFKSPEGLSSRMCTDALRLKGLAYGTGESSPFSRSYERTESMNLKHSSTTIAGTEHTTMMKVDA